MAARGAVNASKARFGAVSGQWRRRRPPGIIFIVISSQLKAKAMDEGKGEWIVMLLRERHRF